VNTPLLQLTGAVVAAKAPEGLGAAWGLTGIIRALPFFAAQNRCVLPLPMLYEMNLMPEQFHHLAPAPGLSAAVKTIADEARAYLAQAKTDGKLFRMQIKMTRLYLNSIEKAGYDPFALRPVPFLALRAMF
jgi:phytoene/squalene synthetase